jgi:hypothetical protein
MRPLRAVLALQCLHLAAAEWKFHEYAKHDTACAPRYINVGMPKCGSVSLSQFYQCHGMTVSHWHNRPRDAEGHKNRIMDQGPGFPGNLVGDETHACDVKGQALLECGPCVDMYGQIDAVLLDHCWVPQITHLAGLIQDYGNATFLLPTRNATAWAHSTSHFNGMHKRFPRCQLPSVGAPRDASAAEGAAFYERVTARARAMLARAEETHGLRWLAFDIADPAAGELLAATVPGGGRAECWGHRNANTKSDYHHPV